jgi:hypothetical protein
VPVSHHQALCHQPDKLTERRSPDVDPEVLQHETVVFAAGSQTESVKLRTVDLFQFQQEQVTSAPLTRQADEDDKEWLP